MMKCKLSIFAIILFISCELSAQSGLCNQEEVDVLTSDPEGATEIATDCFTSCLTSFDQEACMAECLAVAYPNASEECLSCGVDQVDCVTSNCLLACLNPNSAACQECVFNNCSQGFLVCIGDPDADGFTEDGGDCNNQDSTINPVALDIPNDGIDQDCDGSDLIVGLAENVNAPQAEVQYIPSLGYKISLNIEHAQFEVYDLTGRLVQAPERVAKGESIIANRCQETGIFITKLHNEELILTTKVFIK